jgi:adenylylsulfate kinase
MKILIMGLPGSGKTWLADWMQNELECSWYNADYVRKMANDWDFSEEGRMRQADRMKTLADFEKSHGRTVICDFVCPTKQTRTHFNADIVIWMDTIEKGRYADTNAIFEPPTEDEYDYHITEQMTLRDAKKWIEQFIDEKLAA